MPPRRTRGYGAPRSFRPLAGGLRFVLIGVVGLIVVGGCLAVVALGIVWLVVVLWTVIHG